MVDNFAPDKSGNILVEFDYNNIIVVDPNKTIDYQGNISERIVDHESLVMYANLEAYILPRTKLAVGVDPANTKNQTISVASINFLRGQTDSTYGNNGNYFTTGYFDELVGKGSTTAGTNANGNVTGGSANQIVSTATVNTTNNKVEYTQSVVNPINNGLLGITSINVKINTSFIPTVTMELEDVQGKALFQLGDQSPYAAFFNLPYPPFYLTLKGYYGQAIRYQLNLTKFNARFNTFSGNYQVSLEFVGFKFNILNEIQIKHLLAAPHMYSRSFDVSQTVALAEDQARVVQNTSVNGTQLEPSNSDSTTVKTVISEKGYQKIVEVYSEYKAKGLIPFNFPELTLAQLMNKLDMFEKTVLDSYTKTDIDPLTNCRNYLDTLDRYFQTVYGGSNSWFIRNMSQPPFVLKNGERIYAYKADKEKDIRFKQAQTEKLRGYIQTFNDELAKNPTLGDNSTEKIINPIKFDVFTATTTIFDVDVVKTLQDRTGIPYVKGTEAYKIAFDDFYKNNTQFFIPKTEINYIDGTLSLKLEKNIFFLFNGSDNNKNRFEPLIKEMQVQAKNKLANYEAKISADLASKIEDSKTGLGFKPTIRNFIAVIMANAEGFIRLLDDVHTNSWNLKDNPVRKNVILNNNSSVRSSDAKDNIQYAQNASNTDTDSVQPVYPWPQFFVETPEDKKGRFQLKYPGDPSVIGFTQGSNYAIWPEVEFVEEYLKGLTQKFNPPEAASPQNDTKYTQIINTNAIEFPQTGLSYSNKEENKFYYEIYERQLLTSRYTGLSRIEPNRLQDIIQTIISAETKSILASLGDSNPFLTMTLKNYAQNPAEYVNFLKGISNQGTGVNYQEFIRDFFVTPYIEGITNQSLGKSFQIYSKGTLGKEHKNQITIERYAESIKDNDDFTIFDTYPFTNTNWVNKNLVQAAGNQGTKINDTNKVLRIFTQRNVIANFDNLDDIRTNRPVIDFSYTNSGSRQVGTVPTEGIAYFNTPENANHYGYTTSMMNTPIFLNAMVDGINKLRPGTKTLYPFVSAAYLFLNSLPLITLREKYKTDNLTYTTETDYMFATLKKYGAIHKLPYPWILKLGSIWHRYKTYKETGYDIIDSSWTNFDYVNGFDPVSGQTSKEYTFSTSRVDAEKSKTTIKLETITDTDVSISSGFYPKIINDFNLFYNGYDLFDTYSNQEMECSVKNGLSIYNFSDSNVQSAIEGSKYLSYKTWSVILPENIEPISGCDDCQENLKIVKNGFIVPSFGTKENDVKNALIDFENDALVYFVKDGYKVESNPSVYNGTVRMFWEAPNYGYFDLSELKKPNYDEYINDYSNYDNKTPFKFLNTENYSKIEEIFSIFSKPVLDEFEKHFLDFCRSENNSYATVSFPSIGEGVSTMYDDMFNFQKLFKQMMTVTLIDNNYQKYFEDSINFQKNTIYSVLNKFMTFDLLFKFGNPLGYDRRIFDSFVSIGNVPIVTDPINFEPYVQGSLPTATGTTTLIASRNAYPKEWTALELEVGFSTIPQLVYKNRGSYITDFFVDNNVKFSVDNIKLLSFIIKIYATQKLKDPQITSFNFKVLLNNYTATSNEMSDLILNGIFEKLRKDLPDTNYTKEKTIQSVIDGSQSKIEDYELFKSLNDKWISGTDFYSKTLFEDMMFLDRASRNIGDTLYLDIFTMRDALNKNSLNNVMTVYNFIASLLINNNFTIMNLPGYVNFYNVQNIDGIETAKPDGSLDFANNLWGTFLNVDYRNSGPKMICFYTGRPSEYLDLGDNKTFRFRSDGFELSRYSDNPLIENLLNKKDWSVSNRCVGFNVDIGIKNQNIFYSFQVSQDNGRATSETVNINLNMINQYSGRDVATQNVGLYNLYKSRSYQSTIYCLGNALLQPTMYFNLRHVPMFNGPYFITEVNHTITPGQFQTQITGTRQGIFDLPAIDSYLQSINRNLLTKVEKLVKNKKDETDAATTDQQKGNKSNAGSNLKKAAENACESSVKSIYKNANNPFISVSDFVAVSMSPQQFLDIIKQKTINPKVQAAIFAICYLRSGGDNKFNSYNNNFAAVSLDVEYSPDYEAYFDGTYTCYSVPVMGQNTTIPLVNFESAEAFMQFFVNRIYPTIDLLVSVGVWKYAACDYPYVNFLTSSYFEKNKKDFERNLQVLKEGLILAKSVNINFGDIDTFLTGETPTKKINLGSTITGPNGNTTFAPAPTPSAVTNYTVKGDVVCPPPTIIGFSPLLGNNTTPLTISGTNLSYAPSVKVGVQSAIVKSFTNNTIVVIPPQASGKITVTTIGGSVTSEKDFVYLYKPTLNPPTTTPNPNTPITEVPATQQTQVEGSKVFVDKYVKNMTGSDSSLLVASTGETGWNIINNHTEWSWQAINVEIINNVKKETIIDSQVNSEDLENYVISSNTFRITESNIESLVKEWINDEKEWGKVSQIKSIIKLEARSENEFTKYNETKNPKDVIPRAIKYFDFLVNVK